jgi:hypothetical protein
MSNLTHFVCFSASMDILYARQAPSSEKKYNNLADIVMKK